MPLMPIMYTLPVAAGASAAGFSASFASCAQAGIATLRAMPAAMNAADANTVFMGFSMQYLKCWANCPDEVQAFLVNVKLVRAKGLNPLMVTGGKAVTG